MSAADAPHGNETPPAPDGAGGDIDIIDGPELWHAEHGEADAPDDGPLPETAAPPRPTPRESDKVESLLGEFIHNAGTHLDELRRRIVLSLAVFVPLFIVGVWQYQVLWQVVIAPLDRTAPHLTRFQALNPSDGLVMAMRIAFAFALFLSMPVWLAQAWNFIAPGLTAVERRWLYLAFGSGSVLFILGAALAYFAGVPFALEYLLPFNQSLSGWENAFTGSGYVDFVITCCAGFGVAFELPLVMLFLGWIGILTSDAIRQWWRMVALFVFFLAAIMTPPDPFTQLMLAVPMLALFFLGYWLVKWTERRR